jgi:hypothetical protein
MGYVAHAGRAAEAPTRRRLRSHDHRICGCHADSLGAGGLRAKGGFRRAMKLPPHKLGVPAGSTAIVGRLRFVAPASGWGSHERGLPGVRYFPQDRLQESYSRVDAERIRFGALRRDALMAQPSSLRTRFRRQPRAPEGTPLWASGVDCSARPSNGLSCQECRKKRVLVERCSGPLTRTPDIVDRKALADAPATGP